MPKWKCLLLLFSLLLSLVKQIYGVCEPFLTKDWNKYDIVDGVIYQTRSRQTTCKKCDDFDVVSKTCIHYRSHTCYDLYAVMHFGPSKRSCNICISKGNVDKKSTVNLSNTLNQNQKIKVYASQQSSECYINGPSH